MTARAAICSTPEERTLQQILSLVEAAALLEDDIKQYDRQSAAVDASSESHLNDRIAYRDEKMKSMLQVLDHLSLEFKVQQKIVIGYK